MRIAQILPELNVGGVETGTVDLAKALKRMGHEPYVISNGGRLVSELVKVGIPHFKLPVHQKSISSLRLIKPLSEFLERERIEIVHARSRMPAWLAYFAVRRLDCDFVTTCHGYYSKHFMSRVMGWGKRVIVISHSIGRRMIDDFGVSPGQITLIHRGVDLSQYRFLPDKYDQKPAGPLKIINVGRITPIKGHENFIRAVHLVSRRYSDVEALIVGAPDRGKEAYYQDLKFMVKRLGLEDKIKFLGARQDIPKLLEEADLLVLASKIPEAFGRVLIEAGAVGTAVCASHIGGILDVIDDGKNGLLFPPENFEALALTMERLLRDRNLSKRVAHELNKKVNREFTLDRLVDKTCRVYDEVRQQQKILVIKLGAMGDLVLLIPSLRMLREKFPKAEITLLTDSKLLPLIESCPYIDEFMVFDRSRRASSLRWLFRVGRWVRKRTFDVSLDFQNNWRTHLISFLGRVPKRYGFGRGLARSFLTHPVVHWNRKLPPVEHQFQILRRLGIGQLDDRMELWPNQESEKVMESRFKQLGIRSEKPTIGFMLGASPKWQTKQWPREYFIELSQMLREQLNCQIVLLGTKDDSETAERLLMSNSNDVFDQTGKTSLSELVSAIKRLDVLVTGDTSALHIGSGVQTKLVGLFGPTDPKRHLPPGKSHQVLVKHIPCQPCYQGECHNAQVMQCMTEIRAQEVFDAVAKQLDFDVSEKGALLSGA